MDQLAQKLVQVPSCGRCQEAYDDRFQVAGRDNQANKSPTVSHRDSGRRGVLESVDRKTFVVCRVVVAQWLCRGAPNFQAPHSIQGIGVGMSKRAGW